MERIRAGEAAGGKPPDQMSPQELHSVLWQVLTFRDGLVKKIENTIGDVSRFDSWVYRLMGCVCLENIPGLETLVKKIQDMIAGEVSFLRGWL
jgi:hypothetical protein